MTGRSVHVLLAASVVLLIAGCAGQGGSSGGTDAGWEPEAPALPAEVMGVGTVLELDGMPMLCLGAIAESYPPQCSGPTVIGWDWAAVDGEETASGVTWGAYAVWGEWDGETFTLTREPILAALYDPMVDPSAPNPWDDTLPPGALPESEAELVQAGLDEAIPGLLTSSFVNGRVVVEVMFDDGTLQSSVDERYGDDAVVVISSLKPADAVEPSTSDAPWTPGRASLPAEVTSNAIVLEDDDGPRLCLGMVMESYPPQCEGPSILGWDWDAVEGEESAVGTTWGEYRVRGIWDGHVFTLDRPPVAAPLMVATHDPSAPPPSASPDPACVSSEARLPTLRDAVPDIVSVMIDLSNGCVVVGVEYDDGTLQAAVDEHFGAGVFIIGSSFEPVTEE
jgi:hypothetical protein